MHIDISHWTCWKDKQRTSAARFPWDTNTEMGLNVWSAEMFPKQMRPSVEEASRGWTSRDCSELPDGHFSSARARTATVFSHHPQTRSWCLPAVVCHFSGPPPRCTRCNSVLCQQTGGSGPAWGDCELSQEEGQAVAAATRGRPKSVPVTKICRYQQGQQLLTSSLFLFLSSSVILIILPLYPLLLFPLVSFSFRWGVYFVSSTLWFPSYSLKFFLLQYFRGGAGVHHYFDHFVLWFDILILFNRHFHLLFPIFISVRFLPFFFPFFFILVFSCFSVSSRFFFPYFLHCFFILLTLLVSFPLSLLCFSFTNLSRI